MGGLHRGGLFKEDWKGKRESSSPGTHVLPGPSVFISIEGFHLMNSSPCFLQCIEPVKCSVENIVKCLHCQMNLGNNEHFLSLLKNHSVFKYSELKKAA